MNIELMNTPTTRSEFEHRFNLLENMIRNGKMSISQHLSSTIEGLMKVRRLPNGRIDFLSVNEMARLQANMMLQMSKINTPVSYSSNSDSSPQDKVELFEIKDVNE